MKKVHNSLFIIILGKTGEFFNLKLKKTNGKVIFKLNNANFMPLNNHKILQLILFAFFAIMVFIINPTAHGQTNTVVTSPGLYKTFSPTGNIRRFFGETIYFDISFLWFENAAEAKISLFQKNDQIQARLEAKTKGFIGWFTAYRKHVYEANLEIVDNGSRLRSKEFYRMVDDGSTLEKSEHFLDYNQRKHSWKKTRNGETFENKSEEIPVGTNFDDILTAFYNFRNSVYGKLERGQSFEIPTLPEKGHKTLTVQIRSEEEEKSARMLENRPFADELLLRVKIPKEIFKTENGEIFFWASKHFVPLETTVKDYILFGDLHALFAKREFNLSGQSNF